MAIADRKKAAAAIYKYGTLMAEIDERVVEMERIRSLYISQGVSPTGTALEGNETVVSNAVTSLRSEINNAVWTAIKAEAIRLASHGGAAIETGA